MEQESPSFRLDRLLSKSYNEKPSSTEVFRTEASDYENQSQRFYIKQTNFKIQYSHIYFNRLLYVRPLLQRKLKELGVPACRIVDVDPKKKGEACVIGTLFKEMRSKPSILHQINGYDPESFRPPGKFEKRTRPKDYMYLEDETGRVRLSFDEYEAVSPSDRGKIIVERQYTPGELVTGLIAAVIGKSDPLGVFSVYKILFCDTPKNPNEDVFLRLKSEIGGVKASLRGPHGNIYQISHYIDSFSKGENKDDEFVAIISGLNFTFEDNHVSLKKLKQFLFGQIPSFDVRKLAAKISRVVFAGNILKEEKELHEDVQGAFKIEELYAKVFQHMKKSLNILDDFFSELCQSVNVDLMPGPNDAANSTLPQQPLQKSFFPKAYKSGRLSGITNPCAFKIGDVACLGTSGSNVEDIIHYSDFSEKEIDIMEASLYWRIIAPTAPDTLKCYPFDKDDPFFIQELPHVYFSGNLRGFDTRLFYHEKSKKVCRLITVPEFSQTNSFVIFNLKNLDTFEIKC